jgi:hypothetical protein
MKGVIKMNFKEYADYNLDKWRILIGCDLYTKAYGKGIIEDVTKGGHGFYLHSRIKGKTYKFTDTSLGKDNYIIANYKTKDFIDKLEGVTLAYYKPDMTIKHCWACKELIKISDKKCSICKGYFCTHCGVCLCGYNGL